MELTIESVAQSLDGVEYREEDAKIDASALRAAGIVVAFGASDDLLELRGAVYDEFSAWEGTTLLILNGHAVSKYDLLGARDGMGDYDHLIKWIIDDILNAGHPTVTAEWAPEGKGCAWEITTTLPYAPFRVMKDGELYCYGAVFKLPEGE